MYVQFKRSPKWSLKALKFSAPKFQVRIFYLFPIIVSLILESFIWARKKTLRINNIIIISNTT